MDELVPLKKFYLVGRLADLRQTLQEPCPELDTVLRFASLLSYETLLSLAERIFWMMQARSKSQMEQEDVRHSV